MKTYVLDGDGQPVACPDMRVWGKWFEENSGSVRIVQQTTLESDVFVSTVFLGIDHNFTGQGEPALWETLVFGGPTDGEMQRYTSLAFANAGHMAMILKTTVALQKLMNLVDSLQGLPPIDKLVKVTKQTIEEKPIEESFRRFILRR